MAEVFDESELKATSESLASESLNELRSETMIKADAVTLEINVKRLNMYLIARASTNLRVNLCANVTMNSSIKNW